MFREPKENRFFWHVGKDALEGCISMYKKKTYLIKMGSQETSQAEMKEKLEKVEGDPEKTLKLLIELIRKKQSQNAEENDSVIEYDELFKDIARLCMRRIMRRVREEELRIPIDVISVENLTPQEREILAQEKFFIPEGRSMSDAEKKRFREIFSFRGLGEDIGLNNIQKEQLRIYAEEIGLPASLYWDILKERNFAGHHDGISLSPRRAELEMLKKHILQSFGNDPSPLNEWLDEWYFSSLPSVRRHVKNVYREYFKTGFDGHGMMGQMVHFHEVDQTYSAQMVPLTSDPSNGAYTVMGYPDNTYPNRYWLHIRDNNDGRLFRPRHAVNGFPFSSPKLDWEVNILSFGDAPSHLPTYFMHLYRS